MSKREEINRLWGKAKVEYACLGRKYYASMAGRGSEKKVPIVAAVELDDTGQSRHEKLAIMAFFFFAAIADRAHNSLAMECETISDELFCF
ncbi:hypothetical protein [Cyanobium sp. ATX 6F1]|uniref:hypothetical protein n=1 Tax=unclassified Cyanobium TaxID=2627006 RepID=UPI0020CB899B|nr:hypothetical protein [Cyanobium sp. ATX 6F1]MCP9915852.1 hypothetical protein [Cyanobium sp. ATX 6F1]